MAGVGGILVLAIDDASFLPADTAECLSRALAAADGRLRVVGTVDDESSAEPPALPEPTSIRMAEPLAPAEAEAYLIGRLLHFEAPPVVRRRFDRHTIETLHRASNGLPGELNRLAGAIEREALGARSRRPPACARARRSGSACGRLPLRPRASPAGSARAGLLATALALLPHVGLGLGIPLALLALWLWLAPLFEAARASEARAAARRGRPAPRAGRRRRALDREREHVARRRREERELPPRGLAGESPGRRRGVSAATSKATCASPPAMPTPSAFRTRLLQRPERDEALARAAPRRGRERRALRRREEARGQRERVDLAIARLDVDAHRGPARERARREPVGVREVEAERRAAAGPAISGLPRGPVRSSMVSGATPAARASAARAIAWART